MTKIAIMTGGGHISSWHAGIKGIYTKAQKLGYEVYGFEDGFKGVKAGKGVPLKEESIEVNKAGSFLGSSREKIGGSTPDKEKNQQIADEECEMIKKNFERDGIDALIVMGGDDSLSSALELHKHGVKVVGWPKTMDNDLSETYFCFGYPTAAQEAARNVREAYADAQSNSRINILTLFGRDTDWVVAAAGAYGVADLIVPTEQKYHKKYHIDYIFEKVENAFKENDKYKKKHAIVAVAEGVDIDGIESHLREDEIDANGHIKIEPMKLALVLKDAFIEHGEKKVTGNTFSYELRNCPPEFNDAWYAELAGEKCVELIEKGMFGYSAIVVKEPYLRISEAPIEAVAKQRFLKPEGFIDYANLRVNDSFVEYYKKIFHEPKTKEELIYKG